MDSSVFLRIIEDEYYSALHQSNIRWRKDGAARPSLLEAIPMEDVLKFKQWFLYALKATEVQSNGAVVRPEDVVIHAALQMSVIPPYKPLHPKLISVLSLFSENELVEIFGRNRVNSLKRVMEIGP